MKKLLILLSLAIGFFSCEKFEGDQTTPAYLTIDSIAVARNEEFTKYTDTLGFLSNEIPYVKLIVNDNHEVGVFKLPMNIPILQQGKCKIDIYPVVKQSGQSGLKISYPFYSIRTYDDDQKIELIPGQTTNLGTVNVQYARESDILRYDDFEDDVVLSFDTNMVLHRKVDTEVKFGKKCGAMKLKQNGYETQTVYNESFKNLTSKNALYLELDYACNIPFDVLLKGYVNGSWLTYPVMTINGTNGEWKKIYVLLGRTWANFTYCKEVNIMLSAISSNANDFVYVDNVKVLNR